MKKVGQMHIFSPLGDIHIHILSPIDLKFTKFARGAQPFIIINFVWGKNINREGGGQKYELQI